jgi:hypothetical protein
MSRPVIEIQGFRELQEKNKTAQTLGIRKKILLILRQVAKPTIQAAKGFITNSKNAQSKR